MEKSLKAYRKRANNHQSEATYRVIQAVMGGALLSLPYPVLVDACHRFAGGDISTAVTHAMLGIGIFAVGTADVLTSMRDRRRNTENLLRREADAGDRNAAALLARLKR